MYSRPSCLIRIDGNERLLKLKASNEWVRGNRGEDGRYSSSTYITTFDRWQQSMCSSQKIRSSTTTTSFSVLGISIIISVDSTLIVISLLLEIVVGYVRQKASLDDHKRVQWVLDNKYQLQRLAYEEAGQGTWRVELARSLSQKRAMYWASRLES